MSRFIGIRHRVKKTADNEARPTQVVILDGKMATHDLENDDAELDFVRGTFPVANRKVTADDDVGAFKVRHVKWRKVKANESVEDVPASHLRKVGKEQHRAVQIPTAYDGLKVGDRVMLSLGGSGNRLAYSLSRRAEELGGDTMILRLPPYELKDEREFRELGSDKDADASVLADLARSEARPAQKCEVRDRKLIRVTELFRDRMEAMKARIACEQRLRQVFIGRIFLSPEGGYPEGSVEDEFDRAKASDVILTALIAEEKKRINELEKALNELEVYNAIFKPITRMGPLLSARIISAIGDVRRFWVEPDKAKMAELKRRSEELEKKAGFTKHLAKAAAGRNTSRSSHFQLVQIVRSWMRKNGMAEQAQLLDEALECHKARSEERKAAHFRGKGKFKKFLGLHVNPDGSFPRRRRGQRCNWDDNGRQAFWLFVSDQCNKYPDAHWGKQLVVNKAAFRSQHPKVITIPRWMRNAFWSVELLTLRRTGACPFPEGEKILTMDAFEEWVAMCAATMDSDVAGVLADQVQKARDAEQVAKGKERERIGMYSPGHIHKMAVWRTATRVGEAVFDDWTRFERGGGPAMALPPAGPIPIHPTPPTLEELEMSLDDDPGDAPSELEAALLQGAA